MAGNVVVDAVLEQRLTDPLNHCAMGLPGDHHRVDGASDVVGDHKSNYFTCAGFGIDLDFADLATVGIGELRILVMLLGCELNTQLRRHVTGLGAPCEIEQANPTIRADDPKLPVGVLDVGGCGLEHKTGHLLAELQHRTDRLDDGAACADHGARRKGCLRPRRHGRCRP